MGATKRLAELYIQAHNMIIIIILKLIYQLYVLVIIGIIGSVIPIFRKQINFGGPITLSDLNVTRYFMTIFRHHLL